MTKKFIYEIGYNQYEDDYTQYFKHEKLFSKEEFKELIKRYTTNNIELLIGLQALQESKSSSFWGNSFEERYDNLYDFYKSIHILEETRTGRLLEDFLYVVARLLVEEEGFLYEPKKTPDVSLFYSTIGRE